VFVHRDVEASLLDKVSKAVHTFYGADPSQSSDYGRIVNVAHFQRLRGLIDGGGYERTVIGGDGDEPTRYLAPTVLGGVEQSAPVMREEIFGPILPVIGVSGVEEAIARVNAGDKPLALYAFTGSDRQAEHIVESTSSGGVCINGTMLHLGVPGLPFGGVGESGMGAYHGRHGFDTFSHRKSVLTKPTVLDPPIAYPPYSRWKRAIMRKLV
jgi:aldehyde dehydrogenase (NAD+)